MILTRSHVIKIQYVPDPLADDQATIGIIVLSGENAIWKFAREWRLLKEFGREPVDYVFEWMASFEARLTNRSLMVSGQTTDVDYFREQFLQSQVSSIRFSEPHPVRMDPETTLELYSERYLRILKSFDTETTSELDFDQVSKGVVLGKAERSLEDALIRKINNPSASVLVQRGIHETGSVEHRIDVGLKNGVLLGGGITLNFDKAGPRDIEVERNATAFTMDDLKIRERSIPVSVIAIKPPSTSTAASRKRQSLFEDLNRLMAARSVRVFTDDRVDEWASYTVESIRPEILIAAISDDHQS